VSAHPLSERARSDAHKSGNIDDTLQDVFLILVADVFIWAFNDSGAHKQS
jgi:hypothetical protein